MSFNLSPKRDDWLSGKDYHYFWQNYTRAFDSSRTQAYLENHFKLLNASKRANDEAHAAAMHAMSSNPDIKTRNHSKNEKYASILDDNDVEFEISEDLIRFYEESIRFRRDKSEFEFYFR